MPRAGVVAVAVVLGAGCAARPHPVEDRPCAAIREEMKWHRGARAAWEAVREEDLRRPAGPAPRVLLFDATCLLDIREDDVEMRPHGGTLRLPDGGEMPARLATFASTYGPGNAPYLVAALPSVWKADPRHAGTPDVEAVARAVYVHEMTHTRHTPVLGPRIDALAEKTGLGDELDDDFAQKRFGEVPGHRQAWEREMELLGAIPVEPDLERRRVLAREAAGAIRDRRARFLDPDLAALDEIFLTMEGVAQWAAHRALVREGRSPEAAADLVRGGRKWWTQEEGLAAFLAIDALSPDWKARVFEPPGATVLELLEAPLGQGP